MSAQDEVNETALWERALREDGSAFAALFRLHRDRVHSRARALTLDLTQADDVTAVVFFELWRKRRGVPLVDGSIMPWLLVTAINVAHNQRRGELRYRKMLAALPRETVIDAEAVALRNLETELLGVRLTEALSTLHPTDLALLVLTALDDLSTASAATVLDLKPGTARMRLSRARERLRRQLDEHPILSPVSNGDLA